MLVGEDVADPADAAAPDGFKLLEQAIRVTDSDDVATDEPLAARTLLDYKPRVLEHRNVLLHRSEAHGVAAGKGRDIVLAIERDRENVPPGGVRERVEDPVRPLTLGQIIYNHLVVDTTRTGRAARPALR